MTTKVKQWGNSLAIRLPKVIAQRAMLRDGSGVTFSMKNKDIIIVKIEKKKETLEDLLSRITPENSPDLIFPEDAPRGKEIW